MRYAPRDTLLARAVAMHMAQGKKGVLFLGRGGDVLVEVGPTDYDQYVATRKTQIHSEDLKAIAYMNLDEDRLAPIALVENHEGPDPFLSLVVLADRGHWFAPLTGAMEIVERQLGKEATEEET